MRAKELRDLVISTLVLALALGVALSSGFPAYQQQAILVFTVGIDLVAVSLGFVFNELAHQLVARRYNCFAE
jgi:hypothetical protein